MYRRVLSPLVIAAAALGLTLGTACSNSDEDPTPPPETSTLQETPKTDATESPKDNERKDLISFRIDDRSEAGISIIWIEWTIKNNSSEKSNYSWDWEAVDANGTRVANSTELETNVQPGQTAKGEMPTVLQNADGVKLNVTSFQRTAAP